jgi:hypothetical protein
MSAEGTINICETCRRPVEPDALGTVRASKQVDVTSPADTTKQYLDGIGVFLHAAHYPTGSRVYRRDS